jgi:hypothetical protein
MRRHDAAHRLLRAEERQHRGEVFVREVVVLHERQRRAAVRHHAVTQHARELSVGEVADAGLAIGRQVRRVHRAEREVERVRPGQQRHLAFFHELALRVARVAVHAVAGAMDDVAPARDGARIFRRVDGGIRRVELAVRANEHDHDQDEREAGQDSRGSAEELQNLLAHGGQDRKANLPRAYRVHFRRVYAIRNP